MYLDGKWSFVPFKYESVEEVLCLRSFLIFFLFASECNLINYVVLFLFVLLMFFFIFFSFIFYPEIEPEFAGKGVCVDCLVLPLHCSSA